MYGTELVPKGVRSAFNDRLSAFACGTGTPRTNVLGHSQPSPRDWSRWECTPRTAPVFLHAALDGSARAAFWESRTGSLIPSSCTGNPYVLGYSQPELSKLAGEWPSGRRNLLNAWKRTWTSEIGLVLWQCFRPSTSTHATVEMDGRSCRKLLERRAHSRSLGYARDDKVEGGGPPWHEWRWTDRVEKRPVCTSLTLSRAFGTGSDTP